MTRRFVDTSALLAFLDRGDQHHERAVRALTDDAFELVTHRYVEVETLALAQARLGMEAVAALVRHVLPAVHIRRVGDDLHRRALRRLVGAGTGRISFVDWTSFLFMRAEGLEVAIAFDRDFVRQGFVLEP